MMDEKRQQTIRENARKEHLLKQLKQRIESSGEEQSNAVIEKDAAVDKLKATSADLSRKEMQIRSLQVATFWLSV